MKKEINWQVVCNIVNATTNQIYLADETDPGSVRPNRAYISNCSLGGRGYVADEDADIFTAGNGEFTWESLGEKGLKEIYLESAESGSNITITKEDGRWFIEYGYGPDPSYKGFYWDMYSDPEAVKPLDMEYVTQYTTSSPEDGGMWNCHFFWVASTVQCLPFFIIKSLRLLFLLFKKDKCYTIAMKEILQPQWSPGFFPEKSVHDNDDRAMYNRYLPGGGERYQSSDFDTFGAAKKIYDDMMLRVKNRATYPPDAHIIVEYSFLKNNYNDLPPEKQEIFLRRMLSVAVASRIRRELERARHEKESAAVLQYRARMEKHFLTEQGLRDKLAELDSVDAEEYFTNNSHTWSDFFATDVDYFDDFYIAHIIRKFGDLEVRNQRNVDFLIDFWHKYRGREALAEMAYALENQDVMYATKKLLEMLKTEKDPQHITALLFRLEFGKIGISEEGVRYLERVYDLKEMNRAEYYAQRLTAVGQIGVFNEKKELMGFFDSGDLTDGQTIMTPIVHELAYDMLFFPKPNETVKERAQRESYLAEFQKNYYHFYHHDFFNKTGVRFNNLQFKEQFWFLHFHKNASQERREELLAFVKKHGENGLKSFISLDVSEENGEKILAISRYLPAYQSQAVFAKIADLSFLAQQKEDELVDAVYKKSGESVPEGMRRDLLLQANKILDGFAQKLDRGNNYEENTQDVVQLLSDLARSSRELTLIAALLRSAKERGEYKNLADIKGLQRKIVDADDLAHDSEMLKTIHQMYRANNSHKSQQDLDRLMASFDRHMQHYARFALFFFDPEHLSQPEATPKNLVGFMRSSGFDGERVLPSGERYLGALNVHPLLRQFSLASNIFKEFFEEEMRHGAFKMIAHVPENGPSHVITRGFGFRTLAEEGFYTDRDGNAIAKRVRIIWGSLSGKKDMHTP